MFFFSVYQQYGFPVPHFFPSHLLTFWNQVKDQQFHYYHSIILFYRVFIKYCVFSLKCCDFSELCQSCCSAGVRPAIWRPKRKVYTVHTISDTHREKPQSGIYLRICKKTQYLMNILYVFISQFIFLQVIHWLGTLLGWLHITLGIVRILFVFQVPR